MRDSDRNAYVGLALRSEDKHAHREGDLSCYRGKSFRLFCAPKQLLGLFFACVCALAISACGTSAQQGGAADQQPASAQAQDGPTTTLVEDFHNADLGNGWQPSGSMDLQYATCFTIDYFDGGYQLACLSDGQRYLMVPENASIPDGLADDIMVLQQPIGDVYLVASDTMCLFEALDALDRISVSGIARDDWQIAAAREAMDAGRIVYGGKYRAPDYELLLARGVRLAIESSMINHAPDVREKLLELGIPVLVELSSYESEPLGRAEWVRFYGALLGCDDQALQCFQDQVDQVASLQELPSGKTVAFFYLNSAGAAVVRRPGDYVTKMIAQAGGTYVFDQLEEATAGSSSTTLQMERFYALAKDADIIIYNGSIDASVSSLDALLAKNQLLADFKAVREGNVWVTDQNMYQQMLSSGGIIADFNRVFCGATGELTYLRQLS